MNADELFERAKVDAVLDSLAQNVSSYYEALIGAGVAQSLAEQLVRDYSWQWWNIALAVKRND